jgi:hypothetical protein
MSGKSPLLRLSCVPFASTSPSLLDPLIISLQLKSHLPLRSHPIRTDQHLPGFVMTEQPRNPNKAMRAEDSNRYELSQLAIQALAPITINPNLIPARGRIRIKTSSMIEALRRNADLLNLQTLTSKIAERLSIKATPRRRIWRCCCLASELSFLTITTTRKARSTRSRLSNNKKSKKHKK